MNIYNIAKYNFFKFINNAPTGNFYNRLHAIYYSNTDFTDCSINEFFFVP